MESYISVFDTLNDKELQMYLNGQEEVNKYFDGEAQDLYEYFTDAEADYWVDAMASFMV